MSSQPTKQTDSPVELTPGRSVSRKPGVSSPGILLVPAGFGVLIAMGTLLLALPMATKHGSTIGFLDALFMATSATCVTGLATVNVAETFAVSGQVILLLLIQFGGLGIVTAGTLLALVSGSRLSLARERSIHATVGRLRRARPADVFLYACAFVVIIELAGTLALFLRLNVAEPERLPGDVLWEAAFHSVSAFCNAGLSICPGGAARWLGRPDILAVLELLVFLGGIGLLTLVNLRYYTFWRRDSTRRGRLTLQTRIALMTALLLIGIGGVTTLILETDHSQAGMAWRERLSASLFHSTMTRTGGFSVTDLGTMHPATLLTSMVLMFVGGAPGSMAGGIKTVTLALLVCSARSALRREEDIHIFRRRVSQGMVGVAVMITLLAAALVATGILLLMVVEEGRPAAESPHRWLALAFEAFSAFGTVGLSTGITPHLSVAGKIIVILLMFTGRVGPLVLALHLIRPLSPWRIRHPEEEIALG